MRITIANASILRATFSWGRRHFRLPFVVGVTGCVLLGCAADYGQQGDDRSSKRAFPLPNKALLASHPEPGCLLKTSHLTRRKDRTDLSTRVADLATGVRSDIPTAGPSGTTTPERRLCANKSRRQPCGAHKAGVRAGLPTACRDARSGETVATAVSGAQDHTRDPQRTEFT